VGQGEGRQGDKARGDKEKGENRKELKCFRIVKVCSLEFQNKTDFRAAMDYE
jgi:hypothetical protein